MAKKDQRMSETETEEEETEAESMSESESGSEEQKQESKGGGIDYIMSLPDVPRNLPPHVELQRTRVFANIDAPTHTDSIQYSGAFVSVGLDNSFRLDQFRNNFRVEVIRFSDDGMDMEFDMIGIDPALANAFRRILIAEVPTMAIEKVFIANNTSLIQDEVLAHRLGLIPISIDPRLFEYAENNAPNERNTIVFKLHVQCAKDVEEEKGQSKKKEKEKEKKVPPRITVKAKDLKWLPKGSEFYLESEDSNSNSTSKLKTYTSFTCSQDSLPEFSNNKIGFKEPLDDINIARLGPGQVVLLEEIEDEDAETLKKKCPVGVFDIEDIANGRKRLTVAQPRACTLCRECIRGGEEWEKRVSLRRVKDHFIFTIESTGALPPEVLFTEAVKILESKCERVISELS
ncbi:dna-directed rna polymerases i and iii subunit rpac1 [Quercus suber]|uniref:Dna-directed rna polymerases i and iii subunit rpac1 n=1 Tax=Quercus suber TaxID=58331 RepID=A0AAW0M7N6_QUESU